MVLTLTPGGKKEDVANGSLLAEAPDLALRYAVVTTNSVLIDDAVSYRLLEPSTSHWHHLMTTSGQRLRRTLV
jgi:hypothetical protein